MKKLFTINNKDFPSINTTILFNSKFKYNDDAIAFLNNNCEVITKNSSSNLSELPISLLEDFNSTYLNKKQNLTKIDEIKISILNSLISNKKVIVFFNVLTYLESDFKRKVIAYLKDNKKTIINYTSEIEETLLLEYLMVIQNNEIIMEGDTKEILKEEKIIKKLGYNLPFIIELSYGLQYYNLINKTYYDNESLVNDLWK